MFVVCVTVFVKPEFLQPFIQATFDNARNTRKEPGNVRFDVLHANDDPNRFMLYECYHRSEDFALHQQTEHYLRWKAASADWMAQPRQGIKHHSLFLEMKKRNVEVDFKLHHQMTERRKWFPWHGRPARVGDAERREFRNWR